MIKIDKGIKIPVRVYLTASDINETLNTMKVGESFRCESIKDRARIRTYASMNEKITGKKFETRNIEGEKQKYRIWRTA